MLVWEEKKKGKRRCQRDKALVADIKIEQSSSKM